MGQTRSYKDLGGGSDAGWIDNWKEEGFINVWLHREPPWTRRLHNFRQIRLDESGNTPKKSISWLPFTCWEDDEYHKALHFGDDVEAEFCPACRLLEHLRARDDLPDDEVIFTFKAGRERRDILKVDLLGEGKRKKSYMDDLTARTEYIIAVIPADKPDGVYLANERFTLGKKLTKRVKLDIKQYGEEKGDPEVMPLCYTFEYDEDDKRYNVSRYVDAELTEEIQELWEGEAPDGERFTRRGNPKTILEAFEAGLAEGLDIPLDEICGPAIEAWDEDDENDPDLEFPPKDDEDEKPKRKTTSKAKPKTTKPKGGTKSKTKPKKSEKEPEPKKKTKPKRPTRQTKKPEPEPEPDPEPEAEGGEEVVIYECESCGADFPSNVDKCPKCGAEASEEDVGF